MSSPPSNGFQGEETEEEQRGRKLTTRTVTTTSIERTTKRSKSQNRLRPEEQEEEEQEHNGGASHQHNNSNNGGGVGRSQSCGKISKQLRFAEPVKSPRTSDFTWQAISEDASSNLVLRAGKGVPKVRYIDLIVEKRNGRVSTSRRSSDQLQKENNNAPSNGHDKSASPAPEDEGDIPLIVTHVYTSPKARAAAELKGLESQRLADSWALSWKQTVRWSELSNDRNWAMDGVSRLRVRQEEITFKYNIYLCFWPTESQV